MIQPLRKMHRRVFILLAIVLPVLLIAGIRARHAVLRGDPMPKNAHAPGRPAQPRQVSQSLATGALR